MKRSNEQIINKVVVYCDEVISFINGLDYDAFIGDVKTIRATTLCLLQVGELIYHLDGSIKESNPHIDWNGIAGLRHRLVHDYDGINNLLIWDIASKEVGKLKDDLSKLNLF